MPTAFYRILAAFRRLRYPGSTAYWEKRYARGGHSGAGSSGRLAAYKAAWLNAFVREHAIQSVVELGCGDGRQLQLADYPAYLGLDVAPSALARCRRLFAADASKQFAVYDPHQFEPAAYRAELALSLEVLFHLTEDELYHLHLQHLFGCARHWVVVFAANATDTTGGRYPHFRPRPFLADIPAGWALREQVKNPHRDISISDFFIFENISRPNL